ncbi:MAG: phosphoribosylformylglycinamidine synthase [Candidatus Gracilibacteria bacterium]|nr:phosphoribosylformylglycinamidine synthase [Candidatus Gracilibacteria bacterium]
MNDINKLVETLESTREVFVSKKSSEDTISRDLEMTVKEVLGINISGIKIYNNYLVDGLDESGFKQAIGTIFSEAPVDDVLNLSDFETSTEGKTVITIESNPGQYDNRVDAVQQNLTLQTGKQHNCRFKKVIVIDSPISREELKKLEKFLINPVEAYKSSLEDKSFDRIVAEPKNHQILNGFIGLAEKSDNGELLQTLSGIVDFEDDEDGKKKGVLESSKLSCFDKLLKLLELSINFDDLVLVQNYFRDEEGRNPTLAEMRLIDTYWSDHCRHTTFTTAIEDVTISGEEAITKDLKAVHGFFKSQSEQAGKPGNTFMEIAQASLRFLKDDPEFEGKQWLDVSIENNAASYKTEVEMEDGTKETWIIMFKNETHNSPTEVEPFGGAATCLGGAIRDLLSGRTAPFQCMRVSGSGNPTEPISETLLGKLSQRAISIGAALGYSSYGNQIGLATGRVQEYFHPGYRAKRFECGFVIGAVKEGNLLRYEPKKGDLVIMSGGRTGRDGVGGATVSSKQGGEVSHTSAAAHVQKGNPVEERKFFRLLLNSGYCKAIIRSNDFGAGGVSVAIGELASGIKINLDEVKRYAKYAGLNDVELAISESQERMSIVIAPEDYDKVMQLLIAENIEGFQVGKVTSDLENPENDRLVMNLNGKNPIDLSRKFLDTNGAQRKANAKIDLKKVDFFEKLDPEVQALVDGGDLNGAILKQLALLGNASQRGLGGLFDSSVGGGTILAPYGGKCQDSPQIGMAAKIPTFTGVDAKTAIISTNGFNPYLMEQNTYVGGIYAIIDSISRIVAMGGDHKKAWVSLQEYFGKLTTDEKYGEVYAGLLGTLRALLELKIAAIGGKDSMSGTTTLENGNKLDVPPTIVSFANTPVDSDKIVSAEFKKPGSKVLLFRVERDENGLPDWQSYVKNLEAVQKLINEKRVLSSSVVDAGGLITAISKLTLGNRIGFDFINSDHTDIFKPGIGDIIIEVGENEEGFDDKMIGETTDKGNIGFTIKSPGNPGGRDSISGTFNVIDLLKLKGALEGTLEGVFPTKEHTGIAEAIEPFKNRLPIILNQHGQDICGNNMVARNIEFMTKKPVAVLPVFPGTNSELDTRHALLKAGFDVIEHVFYTPKLGVGNDEIELRLAEESRKDFADLLDKSHLLVFSGGFSGGDEPDGSAKFIANMMRSREIREAFQAFLDRKDTLTTGICNGFQALIKLGVFNNGKINDMLGKNDPTLTFNNNLRHITGLVGLQVSSVLSPFARGMEIGDQFIVPVSHGEGRILIPDYRTIEEFKANGQIPLQYIDENGEPTNRYNGSESGIAGLTDSTGKIFGMMPHPERNGRNVFKNIPGEKLMPVFAGAYKSITGQLS